MTQFIDKWHKSRGALPIGQHLKEKVDDAPDYHDGKLEALERKVQLLTGLVSDMADSLSPSAQKRLADKMGLEISEDFTLPVDSGS